MKVIIENNFELVGKEAARIIADTIKEKPNCVLGLATGSTPLSTYKELIRMHKEEGLDFSKVTTFNLDEYYKISRNDEQSYYYFMYENLFKHINIKDENVNIPDGMVSSPEEFGENYENKIKECGGIDVQILGIGENGHIGFNEPAEELKADTHLANLTENTIENNARFFNSKEEVPKEAITMGVSTILRSKKILLIASGYKKSKVIYDLLNNDTISCKVPASTLKLHSDVTVILDKEAACEFENTKKVV